jgi:anaerobic selenocysteine-containing dehydrogenase
MEISPARDRLKYPMIRKNDKLERASWEEAMSLIVERTRDVQRRLTNHGIGFYTTGQLFLEEYYALAGVGKAGLNTLHMFVGSLSNVTMPANIGGDGNTRLCTATALPMLIGLCTCPRKLLNRL